MIQITKIIVTIFIFVFMGLKPVYSQANKPENKTEIPDQPIHNKKNDVDSARRLISTQPDFTADMSCLSSEKFKQDMVEEFKSAKKVDFYRHETKVYMDYFSPDEPPVRFTFRTQTYEPFTGDIENHLWFESLASPALLAQDKSLRFEMNGNEITDFKIDGKIEKRELIKIKVTGETEIGGDFDKAEGFLYVAPELKNLVVRTELIFPTSSRICSIKNISFNVSEKLFEQFSDYRRQIGSPVNFQKTPKKTEKIFLRGSIYRSWFNMKLERDGNKLSGSYFYEKFGNKNTLKLHGRINADGTFVLREFNQSNRQTGKFEGVINNLAGDGRITFSGIWKNSPKNVLQFSASGQIIDFADEWQIRTKTIIEKNKNKHFQIFAPYPEIALKDAAAISGFNLLAKELVEKPVAIFRKRMVAQTAKDFELPLFKDGDFYNYYYIKFADDNLISIQFFFFEFSNGMDDISSSVKTLNYDLKNKRRLNLAMLFKPDAKYLELLSAYCKKDLKSRNLIKDEKSADEKLKKVAGAFAENFENWNLTKTGLLINFDGNKIISDLHGSFSVLIPFSELKEIAEPMGMMADFLIVTGETENE